MPLIRPKEAPTAIDGTKMPAGTLDPYEMTTSTVRRIVAIARDKTIDHRFSALHLFSAGQTALWRTYSQSPL